ncbi:MAG: hypothetical protein Kow0098_29500 [Ignavibacteriaceae bacterium]
MPEYSNTDQQIHFICQVIAKVNRSLVPEREDDSHTNLFFDSLSNRIYGRWFTVNSNKYILFFDLNSQSISLQNQYYQILQSVKIYRKKITDLETELSSVLKKIGVTESNLMAPLHFEIPDYPFSNSAFENFSEDKLQEWIKYRTLANTACYTLLGHLQSESEVRIWPHHFDTGIYSEINDKTGIGFGLAMKDEMVGEPYFYFSGYGLNEHAVDYTRAKPLSKGRWITEGWKGGVLPLSQADEESIYTFLKETTEWALSN